MKFKRILMAFAVLSTAIIPVTTISSCGGGSSPSQDVKVTKITISSSRSSIEINSTLSMSVKVEPDNATNKNVSWSVSSSSLASIDDNGLLTAKSAGTVTVTATAKDGSGIKATKDITITQPVYSSETWEEYLFNRTFSLYGNSANGVCGTCWILADATPDILDDYQYYIVTNWHVAKDQLSNIMFSCDESSPLTSWISFPTGGYQLVDDSLSTYNNKDTITVEGVTGLKGCDIHVAKANFVKVKTTAGKVATTAKAKLDKLNNLTKAGQPITQLAPATTDSNHFENKKMYTGGYPSHVDPIYEKHDLTAESESLHYDYSGDWFHTLNGWTPIINDCTPQYVGDLVQDSWMDGGASGSMLFADFGSGDNHLWKVCGIYWGGFNAIDEQGKETGYFWPCFSIFNSSWKNFLSTWA